jgi:two-component system LytT family response regulator
MNCYIVDDEKHAIDILTRYISKTPDLDLKGFSTVATTGIKEIKKLNCIDIVFLDVDMPDLSGIETAKLLPDNIGVIFTTAHSSYAFDAFELNAIDFLLKPISYARFVKAMNKAEDTYKERDSTQNANNTLFINPGERGKIIQLALNTITYVEGLKNYVIIHTSERKKHITYLTMNDIQAALPESDFTRIHRSFIVRKDQIESIEGNRVFLLGRIELNLGISYKNEFLEMISMLTVKRKRQ